MSEYGPAGEYSGLRPRLEDNRGSKSSRTAVPSDKSNRDAVTVIGAILSAVAMVASAFVPWLSIRLPGLEHRYLSLNDLAGGKFLVGLVTVLLIIGIPLSAVRHRSGSVLVAIGAGLFGINRPC